MNVTVRAGQHSLTRAVADSWPAPRSLRSARSVLGRAEAAGKEGGRGRAGPRPPAPRPRAPPAPARRSRPGRPSTSRSRARAALHRRRPPAPTETGRFPAALAAHVSPTEAWELKARRSTRAPVPRPRGALSARTDSQCAP